MIFNIKEIKITDLDGVVHDLELNKLIGNFIYASTNTLEWLKIAQDVHSAKETEIDEHHIIGLKQIIESPQCQFSLLVKVPLINYIDSLLKSKTNK